MKKRRKKALRRGEEEEEDAEMKVDGKEDKLPTTSAKDEKMKAEDEGEDDDEDADAGEEPQTCQKESQAS